MISAQRFKQYLQAKQLKNRSADELFGFSNGLTGKYLTGKTVLGVDKIETILRKCPDLNGDWLLTGRGMMLIDNQIPNPNPEDLNTKLFALETSLADKVELIEALKELLKTYKSMKHAFELLAIECVNALFWNYTREDIRILKEQHPDFAYVWDRYIAHLSGQESFNALWEYWMTKFSVTTKNGLIDYALERYGEEKREALESAYQMKRFRDRLDNGEDGH